MGWARVTALAAALGVVGLAGATAAGDGLIGKRVDNFMLPDQRGMGHELHYYAKRPAIVIVSAALGDAGSERAIAALDKLRATYSAKQVEFFVLNSSPADTRDEITAAAKGELPVLADELQLVGRSLGVTRTGEAFVVDPRTWSVVYHGPVETAGAGVAPALDALLAGGKVKVAEAPVQGTAIPFPDRQRAAEHAKISYARDVAPILEAKCVSCHTAGGMGPFAMDSYAKVKGFSPMIREALRTKRMPPFHADAHWGAWKNDMSLSPQQIKTVVNWVEAGAPRGEGDDPLAKPRPALADWPMGKPDVIVKVPAFDVPRRGWSTTRTGQCRPT